MSVRFAALVHPPLHVVRHSRRCTQTPRLRRYGIPRTSSSSFQLITCSDYHNTAKHFVVMAQQTGSRLRNLPRELRDLIYKYFFEGSKFDIGKSTSPGIMAASRQFRMET